VRNYFAAFKPLSALPKHPYDGSLDPIGEDGEGDIFLVGIVVREVDSKVMFPSHSAVHHKFHRKGGGFTGLKSHRTDDRSRWSTPLLDFDVWRFRETQRLIAGIGYSKGNLGESAQLLIPQIYGFFIYLKNGTAVTNRYVRRRFFLESEKDSREQQYYSAT
jgi:hypothetical protein